MVSDPIAARYADSLFELVKREGRIDETASGLKELAGLIQGHEELRQFLVNPGVEVADKLSLLQRLLGQAWSRDLGAFVQMVLSLGRAAHLVEIAEAFSELVDVERGVLRVRVRSARPMPAPIKTRLKETLEQRERRTVELIEEQDPELLGGIQVLVGHRMLDGSLRTQLAALRQRLKSVRVH